MKQEFLPPGDGRAARRTNPLRNVQGPSISSNEFGLKGGAECRDTARPLSIRNASATYKRDAFRLTKVADAFGILGDTIRRYRGLNHNSCRSNAARPPASVTAPYACRSRRPSGRLGTLAHAADRRRRAARRERASSRGDHPWYHASSCHPPTAPTASASSMSSRTESG